jgi:hypothetical protein
LKGTTTNGTDEEGIGIGSALDEAGGGEGSDLFSIKASEG